MTHIFPPLWDGLGNMGCMAQVKLLPFFRDPDRVNNLTESLGWYMAEPGFRTQACLLRSPCYSHKAGLLSPPVSPSQGSMVLLIHLEFPNIRVSAQVVPFAGSPSPVSPAPAPTPKTPFRIRLFLLSQQKNLLFRKFP